MTRINQLFASLLEFLKDDISLSIAMVGATSISFYKSDARRLDHDASGIAVCFGLVIER